MLPSQNIIDCYNRTAIEYARKYIHELEQKHFDRIFLKAFATENVQRGKMIDLGCGPGQTTRYLADCGVTDLLGIDIAPAMIEVARKNNPLLRFETADLLQMPYAPQTFGSAIAFYSLVHFDYPQVSNALKSVNQVLVPNGQLLLSFHTGDSVLHLDRFLEQDVDIDFYFFETKKIVDILAGTGFEMIDAIERNPYPHIEYPSTRAYLWVKKTKPVYNEAIPFE